MTSEEIRLIPASNFSERLQREMAAQLAEMNVLLREFLTTKVEKVKEVPKLAQRS